MRRFAGVRRNPGGAWGRRSDAARLWMGVPPPTERARPDPDMERPPPGGRAGAVTAAGTRGGGGPATRTPGTRSAGPEYRGAAVPTEPHVAPEKKNTPSRAVKIHPSGGTTCRLSINGVSESVPAPRTSDGRPVGPGRANTAAFFDLDKTVIAKSSSFAFGRPFYRGGLINRAAVLRSAYAQFVYVVGGMDHDQMERTRAQLQQLVTGWPVEQVRSIIGETMHDLIDPMIYSEALSLINEHHAAGRDVVIVSTSGSEVVEPIGAMLGADHVIATRMVVEDGKYTGEIAFYAYAEHKAKAIQEMARANGYDLSASYAYSDSATDLPMLETVGHPHAVNPDRTLRAEAAVRDWPILDFATPVGLRRRTPDLRTRQVALATVGAAAAAGVVWYAGRRLSRSGA